MSELTEGIFLLSTCLLVGACIAIVLLQDNKVVEPFEIAYATTIGKRIIQSDFCAYNIKKSALAVILVDGVGSERGGRIAGKIVVEAFQNTFSNLFAFKQPQYYLRRAFCDANKAVLRVLDGRKGYACAAGIVINERKIYSALVGNLSIAVLRHNNLFSISTGHTVDKLANNVFKSGNLSRNNALQLLQKHRTYNYLGRDEFKDIEYFDKPIVMKDDDILIIMTDGIMQALSWKELEEELVKNNPLSVIANNIIAGVEKSTSLEQDNASVFIVRLKK